MVILREFYIENVPVILDVIFPALKASKVEACLKMCFLSGQQPPSYMKASQPYEIVDHYFLDLEVSDLALSMSMASPL